MYLFLAHGSFFAKCLKAPQKITGVFVPGTELPTAGAGLPAAEISGSQKQLSGYMNFLSVALPCWAPLSAEVERVWV